MYRFKTKPFKHQLDCFERSCNKKFFALLMDMGTGKSKVLLDTAAYMFDQGWINAVLISSNKGSYLNWDTNEIPVHFVDHINKKVFCWKANLGVSGEAELADFLGKPFDGLKIFVVNTEAFAYPRGTAIFERFLKSHRTLFIQDESTLIKSRKAKRTKTVVTLGKLASARRISTGSIVDNRPLDAFSQFEFLAAGCLGFTSFYSFQAHYAELAPMTTRNNPRAFNVVRGYKNIADLRRRIGEHAFVIKKEDCLDLPEKIYQTFNVELTDEQIKAYAEMKKKCMTEIDGQLSSVKIILTKLMRLQQIVCGYLPDDEGNIHPLKNNRVDALMDILEETSGQVIIWANYRANIKGISEEIARVYGKDTVLTFFGDTTTEERDRAREVFFRGNDTKGVRFLVSNQSTGGYGNNFTGANTHIFFSNDYNAEVRNQAEGRSHRIGQTNKVTYIDIVTPGTVDEKIIAALKKKKALSDEITASNWQTYV